MTQYEEDGNVRSSHTILTDRIATLERALADRDAQIAALREALIEAIKVIEFFHGKPGWEIYAAQSPEMKRICAALSTSARDGRGENAAAAWQPIESAPKDGTEILVVGDVDENGCWMAVAVFRHGMWLNCYWGGPDDELFPPSHWMPLPAAPSPARAETEARGE